MSEDRRTHCRKMRWTELLPLILFAIAACVSVFAQIMIALGF